LIRIEPKVTIMWHSMWGWDGGSAWFGVVHLLWWALVIAAVVVLLRWIAAGPTRRSPADRAFEILRERFARGEIDQAEYDQRLQRLKDGSGPA